MTLGSKIPFSGQSDHLRLLLTELAVISGGNGDVTDFEFVVALNGYTCDFVHFEGLLRV